MGYCWLLLAVAAGNKDAGGDLLRVESQLSEEQRLEARGWVKRWKPVTAHDAQVISAAGGGAVAGDDRGSAGMAHAGETHRDAGRGVSRVTMDNYSKIGRGMSLAEVQAVLGSNGQQGTTLHWPNGARQMAGSGGVVYTWEEGESTISLMFFTIDGVVKLTDGFFHERGGQTVGVR